jgi:nucleoside-diphosphate-sugar epimerase
MSSIKKKKLLVTGGTGFIGRNLVEHFAKKSEYEVHATHFQREPPDISNVVFHKCDLRDASAVNKIMTGTDILIQAAAATSGSKDIVNNPSIHVTDNAVMNSYILKSASELSVSNVIFFSCTVMYPSSDKKVTEEDFRPDEIFPKYFGVAWTKVYIEKVCEFFSKIGSTKFTVIRHSNIYGPYDKFDLERSHVFGASITKVMTAEKEVAVWGAGEECRDLLFVDDLVSFVDAAIQKQTSKFEIVNVGLGESVSVADLVKRIVKASGKTLEIKFDLSKPTIPTKLFLNVSKAASVYGWSPRVGIDEGIVRTLNWYRENIQK